MEFRQVLGSRYTLLDELGRGGMAVVWRARDEVLGRTVAVKVLAARNAVDPQSRAQIRDEARAAANFSHPNIAQVYDYGEAVDAGTPLPYVVMELVNGRTLQQCVAAGPLPPRRTFRICGEVAAALASAHAEGLVHRDIKMANIMVTPAGAKVVDFGIAAAIGPASDDMLLGTPAYLAPERLTGGEVVAASDVYALGVLLYRLLTGQSPWSVESTTQMLQAHIYVEPAPLPGLPGVPPAVAEMIGRCLRKDPKSRPTAGEVSSALADAAEADRVSDVRRESAHRRTPPVAAATSATAAPAEADPAPDPAPDPAIPAAAGIARSGGALPSGAGGGGAPRVRLRKNKYLLAGGGGAAVIVAALVAWFLISDEHAGGQHGSAAAVPVAPAVSGASGAPSASSRPGPSAPAVTGTPGRSAGTDRGSPAPAGAVGTSRTTTDPAQDATQPGPTAGPTTAPPVVEPPAGTRLTSTGGTVYATCAAVTATLTGWEPASGFEVEQVDRGPALAPTIIFANDDARYRTTVTCVAGAPTAVSLGL